MVCDFTKEELEEIKRCVKYMIDGGTTPYSCLTMDINKKLHTMIQHYCDHSWAFCFSSDGSCIKCVKCRRELQ